MRKAIFLDRDGVINELVRGKEMHSFVLTPEACHIIDGTPEALHKLKEKGYLRIVTTNQPAIARGIITPENVDALHRSMNERLSGLIDAFYTCPHHPEMHPDVPEHAKQYRIPCTCRKPDSGMLLQAAREHNINLAQSFMVGDMVTDIVAGKRAGCTTVLMRSGANDRAPIISAIQIDPKTQADHFVDTLHEVANLVP